MEDHVEYIDMSHDNVRIEVDNQSIDKQTIHIFNNLHDALMFIKLYRTSCKEDEVIFTII